MKRVLVTGGTGCVGKVLVPALARAGWDVVVGVRARNVTAQFDGVETVVLGDLGRGQDFTRAIEGLDALVHLAAETEPRERRPGDHRRVNTEATARLADAAIRAKVERFVFLSSLRAIGTSVPPGSSFSEASPCAPRDTYGKSKLDAEWALAATNGLSWCALRAPPVYGPGMRGGLLTLLWALDRGLPLPLKSVVNEQSFVYVGNLASAIVRALEVPEAIGSFLLADDERFSTPEFLRCMASALGREARLFSVPPAVLTRAMAVFGGSALAEKLLGNAGVDASRLCSVLDWQPPFSAVEGLLDTVKWYRSARR